MRLRDVARVLNEHAHDHIFKLKFLQQKSCLLNHAQVQQAHYVAMYTPKTVHSQYAALHTQSV